jgi:hypothetical protein
MAPSKNEKEEPPQTMAMTAPATMAMAAAGTPVAAAPAIIMLLVIMPVALAVMVPVPVDIMVPELMDVPEPRVPPTALLDAGLPTGALAALCAKSIWVWPALQIQGSAPMAISKGSTYGGLMTPTMPLLQCPGTEQ